MKRKIIIAVAAVLVLAVMAPAAFAALTDKQQDEVNKIYQQMNELRKQLIQVYVDAGQLTPEQGKQLQEQQVGPGNGPGFGRGAGRGFGGFGPGFGGGGCGNCPLNQGTTAPNAATQSAL
ncbi:MAG: DUF2680 domain-containing protein [Bacillota bacterium]